MLLNIKNIKKARTVDPNAWVVVISQEKYNELINQKNLRLAELDAEIIRLQTDRTNLE